MTHDSALASHHIREFVFGSRTPWAMEQILLAPAWNHFWRITADASKFFQGKVLWSVNSTAAGGGVAEMLRTHLPYARGVGIDARWMVVLAKPPFFELTKRIHNFIHGFPGDGKEITPQEKTLYEKTLLDSSKEFLPLVKKDDIIILHDPQTAGMIPHLKKKGAIIIWRCHIGPDKHNKYVDKAWDFLKPYMVEANAVIFTRKSFVPSFLEKSKVEIIAPSIDPFSPKNQMMSLPTARSILQCVGLVNHVNHREENPIFYRIDGSPARVNTMCKLTSSDGIPSSILPLVVQISRWDRLKDPIGVMEGFANGVAEKTNANLLLAGPSVEGVADDPEGEAVYHDCVNYWQNLPAEIKKRVFLACLPMRDLEENGAIVNALQRQASVIVQKSIHEGFGLTVTEAMWKGKPIVSTAVGGIQDQITHGETGLLMNDPTDNEEFSSLLLNLFEDRTHAEYMGQEAKRVVLDQFLFDRHFAQFIKLFYRLSKE